ncbi:fumarylacetoacetate hydrolase family protein [Streptomyces sp. TRM S81-3]|uniref:Fumarylacetoacetate hydrolase family protein n=1 Tax=Streptomyces griseicoloratus TaxID=2752516 RepID=A0A926L7S3_9ACTN|nr:fumarylacetoacetate hydrolase family protein [Streptomyces griseicoloratus]MBD0421653.1 fumarylacetoacetate hydrolase family protein [Streptomyces griseicoloratus]
MRIARVAHADGVDYAVLDGTDAVLIADPFATTHTVRLGRRIALADVRLLAPVVPRTVVGMAHNTGPDDRRLPPQAFLKPARSVVGPGEPIPLPTTSEHVDAEAELAVVLRAPLAGHSAETVHEAVLGYTVANDVTARDLQRTDPLWTTAKGQYGFTPLGPWVETALDPDDVQVGLSIDGRPLRPASTAHLARGVTEILCHLAAHLPLGAGDVVLTGAPGEYGPLRPGGRVEATVTEIGSLANPVIHSNHPPHTGETPCP